MYPFWKPVVEPILRASQARRVVEIGALRGETTVQALDALGPDAELHVIDPLPEFDPEEHERRFPGRYVFHRDLSLKVLPGASAFDLALVDGDHNWYTVYHELCALRDAARRERRPLPVLILHDVGWPYGRRDLYYEPSQIPPEYRQPHDRRGMRPGRAKLLPAGGFNITLHNAVEEGGPRNGVMTALEDFMAEHDQPLRRVVLPIYYGLAIVAEERLLTDRPALVELLDELESPEGTRRLLELSEEIRLDEAVFGHNIERVRNERRQRTEDRYLALLRSSLLGEPYLEQELRIEYLLGCANERQPVDLETLGDPMGNLRKEARRLRGARERGVLRDESGPAAYFPHTSMGTHHLEYLDQALRAIVGDEVRGDLVECGKGRGGGAIYLRGFLEALEIPDRMVWVADRFRSAYGWPDRPAPLQVDDLGADLSQIRGAFSGFDLLDDRVRFLQGALTDAISDAPIDAVALLRFGPTAGVETGRVLDELYPRLTRGGFVIVEDTSDQVEAAVTDFRSRHNVTEQLERVGVRGWAWRKERDIVADRSPTMGRTDRKRVAAVPPAPVDQIDLSVVVVAYEMQREMQRTLHSLSRSYQDGADDVDYEVIVVENGSSPERRLGEELVRSFGPEFRYLDLGTEATPSPTDALNRGIAIARGEVIALMIDGAHVVTPGVIRLAMAGLAAYEPAVVGVQQWYVGPGQQPDMVDAGYDQSQEDELFDRIAWPDDGYRLFDISHFIGERDWFDGFWESNCLFVPRGLLEQVGGLDDSFSMPGGGYANLELFERLGSSPDVTVVSILGEGSFHQVHGGTTTNDSVRDDRRSKIVAYGDHYRSLRGRTHRGPAKAVHYVGALATPASRRTRSRRMIAPMFSKRRAREGPDGLPTEPRPIADEMREAFIEAYWAALPWQRSTWLGHRVGNPPTDLSIYQEILVEVMPDWIVETGTRSGGRAMFLASVCDLLGHGQVISVGDDTTTARPEHARITYVEERPFEERAFTRVREISGPRPHALVVLGSTSGAPRLMQEFEGYAPLVPVGSYVVVENTIVNGHPVWPAYGPGPAEAVKRILGRHGEFVQDSSWERHGLTFNTGGYLRRVK
jgi:cephalosporin hydroxylase